MRRFEFVEGSSQKFWEIELQGTEFTVRWGRIGTSGQTQQKSFANTAKAQAEHDKLVAEKQKKGYSEVGGGDEVQPAAPAPAPVRKKAAAKAAAAPEPASVPEEAPAPAPAPAAPAPSDAWQPIAWSEALVRRVHPRRGGLPVPVRPLTSAKKAWAATVEAFVKYTGQFQPKAGDFAAQTAAVAARLRGTEPSIGTPEEDAVLLAFVQHKTSYNGKSPNVDPAVDLLFSLGGPVHATRAVLLSLAIHLEGAAPAFTARRGPNTDWYNTLTRGELFGLPRLRALLATQTDDAGYAAAREAAAALQEQAIAEQRAGAAFLFPTEKAWVRAEAEAYDKQPDQQPDLFLCSLSDRATLGLVAPHLQGMYLLGGYHPRDYLPSALDGLGVDALELLRAMATQPYSNSESRRGWAELVSVINSDEAMTLLLDHLDKEVMPFALEAGLRWPGRALRLLVPRAAQRGKEAEAPRAVLTTLVRRASDAVKAELPGLSEEARKLVTSLQLVSSGPDVPEASPSQLPPVLANPPWKAGKPAALPVLADVTPPAITDTVVWREGEREAWSQEKGWEYGDRYSLHTPEQWQKVRKALPPNARPRASFFVYAPVDLALEHIANFEPDNWGDETWMPAMAAHLGAGALPALLLLVNAKGGESYRLLLPFGASRLAPQVAEAFANSKKARPHARAWLLRHPEHAAAGLLPAALGKQGKLKEAACAALRLLAANGHEATVLGVAGRVSPQVREAAAQVLAFDPLLLFPQKLPKLPGFFAPGGLPRPLLADRSAKLPIAAVETLGMCLAISSLEEPYPGLAQVKAACEPASLARFAWGLFEAWMVEGAPSKEAWAFQALGHLGDDDCARKLAPLIRQWPGEAAHARAVTGLSVLAAIGTDVTLIYLNGIAEKVKFKGLQQNAQEKIAQIAEARGLTRDELADRLVPDLGLDENGSLPLDFGERTFTVGFDEQLKPFVKDATGARLKDLPKPTKKDDPEKSQAAEERWKALKKDAKAAAGLQVLRMELAMCGRRRWSAETFRQFFVEHPLLIHVVRRLVWGSYTADGKLAATFRVAEDRTYADLNEDTWTLPDDASVGIPHALELDGQTAGAWGQIFADYQLLQPFAQLGRPTYAPTAEERTGTELVRVKGLKVNTGKVLGLETRGWRRGPPQDAGVVGWMEKHLGPDRMIELDLDPGLYTGMLSESPEQTLGTVTVRKPNTWGKEGTFPLGTLDPILFSELVRDLEGLRPA
jgi:predicted DNA-binding WGR domain protein